MIAITLSETEIKLLIWCMHVADHSAILSEASDERVFDALYSRFGRIADGEREEFAGVTWCDEDVLAITADRYNREDIKAHLQSYEDAIEDSMVDAGWTVINEMIEQMDALYRERRQAELEQVFQYSNTLYTSKYAR
jgi:hypothetical protein